MMAKDNKQDKDKDKAPDWWVPADDKDGRERLLARAREAIIDARTALNASMPFFGTLVNYLPDVYMWPEEMAGHSSMLTAYTNGLAITWNPFFVMALDEGERCFVLEHEVMHVAMQHVARLTARDIELWNCACDYTVNFTVQEANKGLTNKACYNWEMPSGLLYDKKYDGDWSADDVYAELMRTGAKKLIRNGSGSGTKPGHGKSGSKGSPSGGASSDGGGDDAGENAGESDAIRRQVERDVAEKRTVMTEEPPAGSPEAEAAREAGGDGALSPAEREAMWNERLIRAATIQAGVGSMPASLSRLVDKLLKPKMDWRAILAGMATAATKSNITFRRPDRRWIGRGLYLPSLYDETLREVVVIIDDSGSCYEEVPQFISEAVAIFDQFPGCLVRLVRCDTHPTHVCDWEPGQDDPSFAPNVTVGAGGGTSFVRPFSELLPDMSGIWQPSIVVYLTDLDGELPGPEHDPGCPTLWVCTNTRHDANELPFGTLAYFDKNAKEGS